MSGSQYYPIWRSETDRVMLQAVDIIEISFKLLKAGEKPGSQYYPIWRSETDRMILQAVDIIEMTFKQVLIKI